MSDISEKERPKIFARSFYCEHTKSKSRVLALVSNGVREHLRAVLTCSDAEVAVQVSEVLTRAAHGGHGPQLDLDARSVATLLPDAPRSSFQAWIEMVCSGTLKADPAIETILRQVRPLESVNPDDEADPLIRDSERRTPSDARLRQLPGTVIRIVNLVELHVHDPDRLRDAALANGWELYEDDDHELTEEDELLDAAMFLVDGGPEVPGADIVTQAGEGKRLDAASGDDVCDWSTTTVQAAFDSGWRLRREDRQRLEASLPKFDELFHVEHCDCDPPGAENDDFNDACEVCRAWHLTPRTADVLHSTLSILSDELYDEATEHDDALINDRIPGDSFSRLPRISWKQGMEWRRQFARAADDLRADLETGVWPIPRNSAEELALHLALRDAPGVQEMCEEDDRHSKLPQHSDDYGWGNCEEYLFQDFDVLLLYDFAVDGIEDPDELMNQSSGIGDLRPERWFDWFANVVPRDPLRGFRR